jgi:hypothetical protein
LVLFPGLKAAIRNAVNSPAVAPDRLQHASRDLAANGHELEEIIALRLSIRYYPQSIESTGWMVIFASQKYKKENRNPLFITITRLKYLLHTKKRLH